MQDIASTTFFIDSYIPLVISKLLQILDINEYLNNSFVDTDLS
jgi:hypothetical protein